VSRLNQSNTQRFGSMDFQTVREEIIHRSPGLFKLPPAWRKPVDTPGSETESFFLPSQKRCLSSVVGTILHCSFAKPDQNRGICNWSLLGGSRFHGSSN